MERDGVNFCIGIDFDNTIVNYDGLFYQAALDKQLIPDSLDHDKTSVRNYLRKANLEDEWTILQGEVYGPGIFKASPYEGLLHFIRTWTQKKYRICIISHRSKTPYLGEKHDLHSFALQWLKDKEILSPELLKEKNIFYEISAEDKVKRIKDENCDLFIDDLPEFLQHQDFDFAIKKILFDPKQENSSPFDHAKNWQEVLELTQNYFEEKNGK